MMRTVLVGVLVTVALSGCLQDPISVNVEYTLAGQQDIQDTGYSYQVLAAPNPRSDQLSVQAQGAFNVPARPDNDTYQLVGVIVDAGVPVVVKIFNGQSVDAVASGSGVAMRCAENEALFHVQISGNGAASVSHGCA